MTSRPGWQDAMHIELLRWIVSLSSVIVAAVAAPAGLRCSFQTVQSGNAPSGGSKTDARAARHAPGVKLDQRLLAAAGVVCPSAVFAVALLVALSHAAYGQPDWTGMMSNNWNDPSNWNPAGVPTDMSVPAINTNTTLNAPTIFAGTMGQALALTLGSDVTDVGNLTVANDGALSISGPRIIVGANGTGTLIIQSGGTVNLTGTPGDTVIGANSDSSGTVTVNGTLSSAGSVFVGYSGTGELTISNRGTVTDDAGLVGSNAGSTGAVTVTDSGSAWHNGDLTVGNGDPSNGTTGLATGTLNILNSGVVSSADGFIGGHSSAVGTVMVSGNGSAWTNTGVLTVGQTGTGTLSINDDAEVTATGGTIVARDAGSAGTINIGAPAGMTPVAPGTLETPSVMFGAGTGLLVFNHTDNTIGDYLFTAGISGPGTVDVVAGTTAFTGVGNINSPIYSLNVGGRFSAYPAIATVNGSLSASSVLVGGSYSVGSTDITGPGTLNVNGGGVLTVQSAAPNGNAFIGGNGTVTVSGSGSQWNMINAGGSAAPFVSGGLFVGGQNGTAAALTVTNGGSASSYTAVIGALGPGTLTVENGGTFSTGNLDIGGIRNGSLFATASGGPIPRAGFPGTVTVEGSSATGVPSTLNASGSILVGVNGSQAPGQLNILDGAKVTTGSTTIAGTPVNAQGTGAVLVSGTGSTLMSPGSVAVGQNGTGTLTVQNGGTVITNVITTSTIGFNGLPASGTINIGALPGQAPVAPGVLQTPEVELQNGIAANLVESTPGTLNFNHTSTNYVFTPMITGPAPSLGFPNIGIVNVYAGTTIFTANSDYGGGTNIFGGTAVVGNPPPPGTASSSAALSGGGPITVAPGGTLGGFGSVTGNVTNNGTVAAGNASAPIFATDPAGIFTIQGNLLNNATVDLASDPVFIGNVLRINGNYTASGASPALIVNTDLNAGGPLEAQLTDRLLVFGNATGTTMVQVKNPNSGPGGVTGLDADDGISIVQVAGASTQDAFRLPGAYITGGTPYQYHLNAFGPGSENGAADPAQSLVGNPTGHWDFRLQLAEETSNGTGPEEEPPGEVEPPETGPTGPDGEPPPGQVAPNPPGGDPEALPPDTRVEVAPQVPAYLSTARGLFQAGLLDIGTLHQRLGEIQDDQSLNREGIGELFVRAYGGLFNYTTNRGFEGYGYNFNEDYAAVQFGGNYNAINNEYGTFRVGLAGAIGRMWLQPSAIDGMSKALFNTQNFFGMATWQARTGWYVDGIVMGGLFDGRYTTPDRGQTTGMNGTAVAVSAETGFPFPLPWDFSFEPQAQIVWQHLNFQNRIDVDGIDVDLGSPDQVTARVGFRLKRPFQTDNGMLFTPYLKANVLQGIGSSSDVVLSGVAFGTGNVGTALQVGGGITGTLTRCVSLYGDFAWQSQVGNGGGFRGWVFNGGLRVLLGQPRAPAPALVPAAVPAPQAARSYLVFFDWDKATLTSRARQIIREAAESSTRVAYTRIEVNGYTDTSGTPKYNQGLSIRRAQAVAGELVRDGVPASAISIRGFGETHLLVPTGPGVREPQNRRVEIVML